jgi:hypothetical protein
VVPGATHGVFLSIGSPSAGASVCLSVHGELSLTCSTPLPKAIPERVLFERASYKQISDCMRLKVLAAVYIEIIVFYDVTPCSLVYGHLSAALHGIRSHKTIILKLELPKRYETASSLLVWNIISNQGLRWLECDINLKKNTFLCCRTKGLCLKQRITCKCHIFFPLGLLCVYVH